MNRRFLFMAGLALPAATFAQGAADPDTFADNWETVAAGGGRFFFALVAGILLAYAFQWILTSLSLATGATAMGAATKKKRKGYYREDRYRREGRFREEDGYREEDRVRIHDQDKDSEDEGRFQKRFYRERDEEEVQDRDEGWEKPVMKIQSGIGVWALVTTGISTFVACWLASELLRFGGRAEAVVLCLTIWAGFMLSMMWMEASVLGTVFGHIVNTFKGGVKSAFAPVKSMAGAAGEKASASLEEITAKVKEEFAAKGGGEGLKERLKGFASGIQSPGLERSRLEQDCEHLFHDEDVREAARQGGRIDRRRLEEIVASRGDLGPDDSRTLTEVLHGRWNRCVEENRQSQGSPAYASQPSYAQPPIHSQAQAPVQSQSAETSRLEVHTGAGGANPNSNIGPASPSGEARASEGMRSYSSGGFASGAYGSQSVSPLSGQSQPGTPMAGYGMMGQGAGRSVGGPSGGGFPARFQGFKDYLRASDKHDLNPARIEQEMESLVIHPEEGSAGMERSIREVNRDEVVQCLRQRRDITLQESDSIADLVDAARQRMLSRSEIREHRTQEASDKALAKIRDWVYGLKRPELDYDSFRGDFAKMLEDPQAGIASLKGKAQSVDRGQLIEAFAAKKGISRQEAEKMADQAENAMRAAQEKGRMIEEEARRRMEKMRRASLEQAEAARKVAASAAWWLFGIACFTAICAALGGLTGAAT